METIYCSRCNNGEVGDVVKLFNALLQSMKHKDEVPQERLDMNRVRVTLEDYCEQYLSGVGDIFVFEALPGAIDGVVEVLGSEQFLERYDFEQVDDTLFAVRLKDLELL